MTKQAFLARCMESYSVSPDYPFEDDFETAVLRHTDNRRWFALVMRISRRKLGIDSDEMVDVVNLKLPAELFGSFGRDDGVYPAYHMNKRHWITAALDGTADEDKIKWLLDISYDLTGIKRKKQ